MNTHKIIEIYYNDILKNKNLTLNLTRRPAGFEILNNTTLIFQKWLVSRHFANIFHYIMTIFVFFRDNS